MTISSPLSFSLAPQGDSPICGKRKFRSLAAPEISVHPPFGTTVKFQLGKTVRGEKTLEIKRERGWNVVPLKKGGCFNDEEFLNFIADHSVVLDQEELDVLEELICCSQSGTKVLSAALKVARLSLRLSLSPLLKSSCQTFYNAQNAYRKQCLFVAREQLSDFLKLLQLYPSNASLREIGSQMLCEEAVNAAWQENPSDWMQFLEEHVKTISLPKGERLVQKCFPLTGCTKRTLKELLVHVGHRYPGHFEWMTEPQDMHNLVKSVHTVDEKLSRLSSGFLVKIVDGLYTLCKAGALSSVELIRFELAICKSDPGHLYFFPKPGASANFPTPSIGPKEAEAQSVKFMERLRTPCEGGNPWQGTPPVGQLLFEIPTSPDNA